VKRMHVPSPVKAVSKVFHAHGYEVYLVGGSVRDRLLKRKNGKEDYDLATSASPRQVQGMFSRVIPTGIDHGTVTVLFQGAQFEVTTFRTETTYSDRRRPDSVAYTGSLHEDLSRRDFTINALAVNGITGELTDTQGGMEDLKRRILRSIGDPRQRFQEDALRMLRGCRFSAQLEFTLEEETLEAMRELAHTIAWVSAERMRDELQAMLTSRLPSIGLEYMRSTGVMEHILPELLQGLGVEQKGDHRYDVYYHSVYTCDGAPREHPLLRWAALLHDIGKPACRQTDENGIYTFHRHEQVSAEMADCILRRLCFSNRDREKVVHLISKHMYHYTPQWSDAAVRRFLRQVGQEHLDDLFRLRMADQYGTFGRVLRRDLSSELRRRIESVLAQQDALTIRDLAVDGNDLMRELSLRPGKEIGVLLHVLLEAVLDDPQLNEPARLLEIARSYYREHLM